MSRTPISKLFVPSCNSRSETSDCGVVVANEFSLRFVLEHRKLDYYPNTLGILLWKIILLPFFSIINRVNERKEHTEHNQKLTRAVWI